jgi:cation diffusion facilitator CzcD-associated flavoprotein CzcO
MLRVSGPAGMAALKELRELGFDVTLFERRKDMGGIWTWTEDRSITTALKETQLCNSKFGVCSASAFRDWRTGYANIQTKVGLERFPNIRRWAYDSSQSKSSECDDNTLAQIIHLI